MTNGTTGHDTDRRVTKAEFRCLVEYLGFSVNSFAAHLDDTTDMSINPENTKRAVRRWFSPTGPEVPADIADIAYDLIERSDAYIEELADAIAGSAMATVEVYANDVAFWTARPDLVPLPAKWHRSAVFQAVSESGRDDLDIVYAGHDE